MPTYYVDKMRSCGFRVREFTSIEEYLSSGGTAKIWYFTRPQLERMGEEIREKAAVLRKAITFRREFIPRLQEGTRFYHPLPRHREYPTIPGFLDNTSLNAWDEQSINGYFTRIVEIGLLAGDLGRGFSHPRPRKEEYPDDFVEEAPVRGESKQEEYKVGIKPVERGIVIDHIGTRGRDLKLIWDHIDKIRQIMGLNFRSSHGVYHSSSEKIYKGIISLPDILSFDESQIKMLAAIAPGCTLNIIDNSTVQKKYRLHMPPRVYGFREISCKNENCISRPELHENVQPEFIRSGGNHFICRYCDHSHSFHEYLGSLTAEYTAEELAYFPPEASEESGVFQPRQARVAVGQLVGAQAPAVQVLVDLHLDLVGLVQGVDNPGFDSRPAQPLCRFKPPVPGNEPLCSG